MSQRSSHEIDILHGPILSMYILFVIPIALSTALQLLFNAVDVIVVGRFAGANALAAVGSTTAFVNLMVSFIVGLSSGVNIVIARHYARESFADVEVMVHSAVPIGMAIGLIFLAIGIPASLPILELMKSPEGVRYLSADYLHIYFLGMPAVAVYNFGAAIFRSIGDTKRPLYFLVVSGIVNLLLNLYTVIVLGMGVVGVALATTVSNLLSASLIISALTKENSCLRLEIRKLHIQKVAIIEIIRYGLPTAIQGSLYAISNILVQSSVNSLGAVYMAGNAASQSVEGFQSAFMTANANTTLTFMSQHYGACMYKRAKKVLFTLIVVGMLIAEGIGLLFVLFRMPLLALYNSDSMVINVGVRRLVFVVMTGFLQIIMDTLSCSMRALGHTVEPTVVSLMSTCIFRTIWLTTVFRYWHRYEVIIAVWPVSWIITIVIYIFLFHRIQRQLPSDTD